jgi:ketosteroid isomerase-like protein
MNRLCFLLILLASVSAIAQITDEQQIRQISQAWMDAYNRNDAAAATALYAEDGYYVSQHLSNGIIQGREAIKANIQLAINGGGHIDSIES